MNKNTGVNKMLEAKYKIGDKVFDRFEPQAQGKDAWVYTDIIIGVQYVLKNELPRGDGTTFNVGGCFEYTLLTYDDKEYTNYEYRLGKRRKQ